MALQTDPRLQNQVIYSVYVRNHTPEGTFRAVADDLDRIRALAHRQTFPAEETGEKHTASRPPLRCGSLQYRF